MNSKIIDFSDDGLPIFYDDEAKTIQFKDTIVPYKLLKKAIESPKDRVQLTPDLYMIKSGGFIEFGCLQLTQTKCKTLINYISHGPN